MSEVKCINLTVIAPKEKVEEVEKIFNKHGDWMKSFYADDKEHLLHGYSPLHGRPGQAATLRLCRRQSALFDQGLVAGPA